MTTLCALYGYATFTTIGYVALIILKYYVLAAVFMSLGLLVGMTGISAWVVYMHGTKSAESGVSVMPPYDGTASEEDEDAVD
jgi:hypothetical protein